LKVKKTISELIDFFKEDIDYTNNIQHWKTIPPKDAESVPYPQELDERITDALKRRGITSLYTHQKSAFDASARQENIVAVTPTASGKTLCYNLPVLQSIATNPNSRALYIFPTKALAQDQKSELNELINEMDIDIKGYTYDGDTPANIRQVVRQAGHIVITNPDMLHSAILPHHTKWVSLFENLSYIVIDELHIFISITLHIKIFVHIILIEILFIEGFF
jgi:DEAD/DEAH box helicase domain-containing protein